MPAETSRSRTLLTQTKLTLWGTGTPRTLRPIWMAEELGLTYNLRPIGPRTGETQTEEFTRLTRKQKVPFLIDGNIKLSESLAICRYLQNRFPSDTLAIPQDAISRAKEDEWCCYIYGEIDETALYVMRRHYDLTEVYGAAPAAVEACRAYIKHHFDLMEIHLAQHETLLDIGFGLADIMLVSCLDWALFYGCDLPDHLKAYRDQIAKRQPYQKAIAINYAALREVSDGAA
ncbi:MAG: glutathione S-transferase family protein [Gammaproteobacteria bacterium]